MTERPIDLSSFPSYQAPKRSVFSLRKFALMASVVAGLGAAVYGFGPSQGPVDVFTSTLANAGVGYIVLKEWSKRDGLLAIYTRLNQALNGIDASVIVLPPPPIQGIGNAGGFTMQVELRDGSSDLAKLQSVTNTIVANAQSQSALQLVSSSFRAIAPPAD